jgi:hypothetical protein
MSGIEFLELLNPIVHDVAMARKAFLVLLVWNCCLSVGVIIALTKVKDRR